MNPAQQAQFVTTRKGRYMAQVLEAVEEMAITSAGLTPADPVVRDYLADRDARGVDGLSDAEIEAQKLRRRNAFQHHIEPLLPAPTVTALRDFKGIVRNRFNALATDALEASTTNINGFAQEARDRLSPVGRP